MSKALLVAATRAEIAPALAELKDEVEVLITGVGLTHTTLTLTRRLATPPLPRVLIQAGLGGAVDPELRLGEVVQVVSERITDLGAATAEGDFLPLSTLELPLDDYDEILPLANEDYGLPQVHGGSVNRVNGSAAGIARMRRLFPDVQVESMEGYALALACRQFGVKGIQLRGISNYVEPRNRAAWRIGPAIQSLNEEVLRLVRYFLEARNS